MGDLLNPGASAAANNAAQQTAAVQNSHDAWKNAAANYHAAAAANPSPVANLSVARPPAGASPMQQIAQGIKPLVAGQQPAQAMMAPAQHAQLAHKAMAGAAAPPQPPPVNGSVVSQILAGA